MASHVWPHNTMDLPENIIIIIDDHLQFVFVVFVFVFVLLAFRLHPVEKLPPILLVASCVLWEL